MSSDGKKWLVDPKNAARKRFEKNFRERRDSGTISFVIE
jgi:hypothetical protein